MDLELLKEQAALAALDHVQDGMRLGLGTGSTVAWFLKHLGERLASGSLTDVAGVPTSERTAETCRQVGIPLLALEDQPELDVGVDGADEVTPELELIKGLGGALLREKMIASACHSLVIIADETKHVSQLGEKSPLPVEVIPFAWRSHEPFLRSLGADPVLRTTPDNEPYHTDNGNLVLDCRFESGIDDPHALERALRDRPGVVETGLFLGMAQEALLAASGGVVKLSRES